MHIVPRCDPSPLTWMVHELRSCDRTGETSRLRNASRQPHRFSGVPDYKDVLRLRQVCFSMHTYPFCKMRKSGLPDGLDHWQDR